MLNEIQIFPGRLKKFSLQWKQGSATGPALDTTGATFEILRNTLPVNPTIEAVDETEGTYTLSFSSACTQGQTLGTAFSVTVGLTMPGDEAGYSPDPITIQGFIR